MHENFLYDKKLTSDYKVQTLAHFSHTLTNNYQDCLQNRLCKIIKYNQNSSKGIFKKVKKLYNSRLLILKKDWQF